MIDMFDGFDRPEFGYKWDRPYNQHNLRPGRHPGSSALFMKRHQWFAKTLEPAKARIMGFAYRSGLLQSRCYCGPICEFSSTKSPYNVGLQVENGQLHLTGHAGSMFLHDTDATNKWTYGTRDRNAYWDVSLSSTCIADKWSYIEVKDSLEDGIIQVRLNDKQIFCLNTQINSKILIDKVSLYGSLEGAYFDDFYVLNASEGSYGNTDFLGDVRIQTSDWSSYSEEMEDDWVSEGDEEFKSWEEIRQLIWAEYPEQDLLEPIPNFQLERMKAQLQALKPPTPNHRRPQPAPLLFGPDSQPILYRD